MKVTQEKHLQAEFLARTALIGTAAAAAINSTGMLVELALVRSIPGMPPWPTLAASAFGILLLGLLVIRRHSPTIRFCSVIYLLNTFAVAAALYLTHPYYAALGPKWVPFQANKLACLLTALLAPTMGVGLASITVYAGAAVLQFFLFSPEIKGALAIGEPWATLAFAIGGLFLLWYRIRRQRLETVLVHARAEMGTATRLARTFLQLRDLSNTPLQTIVLTTEMLETDHPEIQTELGRISRAAKRLEEINHALTSDYDPLIWGADELSFDSNELLLKKFKK